MLYSKQKAYVDRSLQGRLPRKVKILCDAVRNGLIVKTGEDKLRLTLDGKIKIKTTNNLRFHKKESADSI